MLIRYVKTKEGRVYKLEDDFIVAELIKGYWSPCYERDEKELDMGSCSILNEEELKGFTSIPGEIVARDNVSALWGFSGEVRDLATSLFGFLQGMLIGVNEDNSISREHDDAILTECIACSYALNRYLALETGYQSFDSKVGDLFLRHCSYEILRRSLHKDSYDKGAFVDRLLRCASDYIDAFNSEDRAELAYLPSWWPLFRPTDFERLFLCLASRCYLRLRGMPEDELSPRDIEEIPDLSVQEASDCLDFAYRLINIANMLVNKMEKAPLDRSHTA